MEPFVIGQGRRSVKKNCSNVDEYRRIRILVTESFECSNLKRDCCRTAKKGKMR